MLITIKPVKAAQTEPAQSQAAQRPVAGFSAGACLHAGVQAGPLGVGLKIGVGRNLGAGRDGGDLIARRALPRLPWAAASTGGISVRGGYQPISRTQFEHMTLINPVSAGGLGPHPVREPEPV